MSFVVATATGFPPYYYPQAALTHDLLAIWEPQGVNAARVRALHAATTVEGRYIAVSKEDYPRMSGWEDPNGIYATTGLDVATQTLEALFAQVDLGPADVALLLSACTTGLAVPTLDARLMNRLPFRPDLKRLPVFGLGCIAGVMGLSRVHDYLAGHPTEAAVLLCQEFCSLTLQKQDTSLANLIACGLFGDGSAAVLLVGDAHPLAGFNASAGRALHMGPLTIPAHAPAAQPPPGGDGAAFAPAEAAASVLTALPGPRIVATRTIFFPESEGVMGWRMTERGMQVVLSAEVPTVAQEAVPPPLHAFLAEHGLTVAHIDHWICHPGGPKVIDAIERGLDLPPDALAWSRDVLTYVGNVSSVSVLLILDRLLRTTPPAPGSHAVMIAMGPAFNAELLLLRF